MPDKEKVIKELHDARRYLEDKEWSDRGASQHIDAINNAIALLKEQDKLVNVDKLREKLGFAESCEKCKKDSWRCQRDTYFTEMDFCNRLDLAIEELTQEGR